MNVFNYIWPLALVVLANTVYQICAKSVSDSIHPLASLTITYFVATIISAVLYFILNKGGNLFKEYAQLNWASFALGVSIIGLEVGFIYAYKAGWQVSTAAIVQSAFLGVLLIFVGVIFFKEQISWNKILGVVICLVGLFFINHNFSK